MQTRLQSGAPLDRDKLLFDLLITQQIVPSRKGPVHLKVARRERLARALEGSGFSQTVLFGRHWKGLIRQRGPILRDIRLTL